MKKAFIVAAVFAAIALIRLICALVILTPCYKTEAVVTFIGLPDGHVFGSFTDESSVMYEEKMMFPTLLIGGNFIALETVEQFYGRKINIAIHPHSGEIYYAPHLYARMIPSATISIVSAIAGAIIGAVQKKCKAPHTDKREQGKEQ